MSDEYQHEPPRTEPPPSPPPPRSTDRVLRRSRDDRVLGGVSGGIGRYFGVDPILIRLAWVALVLAGGTGVLLYIIAWIVIPEEQTGEYVGAAPTATTDSSLVARYLIGGGLVLIGVMLLLRMVIPWFDFRFVWPLIIIAVGAIILTQGVRR